MTRSFIKSSTASAVSRSNVRSRLVQDEDLATEEIVEDTNRIFDAEALLDRLVHFWTASQDRVESLTELRSDSESVTDFEEVHDLLFALFRRNRTCSYDEIWALFVQWAMEHVLGESGITSHFKGLIAKALSPKSTALKNTFVASFEEWLKG